MSIRTCLSLMLAATFATGFLITVLMMAYLRMEP